MDIRALMKEKCISFDQELQSKDAVFQYLSIQLYEEGYIDSVSDFLKALYYRESLSETGLGGGIAIPHGKADCVTKAGIAFVRLKDEIPWESLDEKPVRYVFMLSIPSTGDHEHIKMISELARSLIRPDVIHRIGNTLSVEELMNCFQKEVSMK